jgi:hypothetical protein
MRQLFSERNDGVKIVYLSYHHALARLLSAITSARNLINLGTYSPHVQTFVMRIAIEAHNSMKQDSVH